MLFEKNKNKETWVGPFLKIIINAICGLEIQLFFYISSEEEIAQHTSDGSCSGEEPLKIKMVREKNPKKKRKNVEFSCGECLKFFSSKQALSNHKLLHNNQRNYDCEFCDKKFVAAGALHNHKK